jgi:hypothetical protein
VSKNTVSDENSKLADESSLNRSFLHCTREAAMSSNMNKNGRSLVCIGIHKDAFIRASATTFF